jgi:predicted regulator of Ras-like GTPase activity (Roadblock/LC7/MglB family)
MLPGLDQNLRKIVDSFGSVKHVAILNVAGDIVATAEPVTSMPQEFEEFVMSLLELSKTFMKLFVSHNVRHLSLRGVNESSFFLYSIDDSHILVFYVFDHAPTFFEDNARDNLSIQPIIESLRTQLL